VRSRPQLKSAYHHKDLRNALVEETLTILDEGGVEALTLRELARRLGVTHAAPYAHFADKRALLEAVAEIGFERLAARCKAATEDRSDLRAAFVALGQAYVAFALEHPGLYRLMFVAPELAGECGSATKEAGDRAFDVLVEMLRALRASAGDDDETLRTIAFTVWAGIHGLSMLVIDARVVHAPAASIEQLAALASTVMLDGISRFRAT
jgi:AcrR family transcriptional regulator